MPKKYERMSAAAGDKKLKKDIVSGKASAVPTGTLWDYWNFLVYYKY
jgi:hypothetical protein